MVEAGEAREKWHAQDASGGDNRGMCLTCRMAWRDVAEPSMMCPMAAPASSGGGRGASGASGSPSLPACLPFPATLTFSSSFYLCAGPGLLHVQGWQGGQGGLPHRGCAVLGCICCVNTPLQQKKHPTEGAQGGAGQGRAAHAGGVGGRQGSGGRTGRRGREASRDGWHAPLMVRVWP